MKKIFIVTTLLLCSTNLMANGYEEGGIAYDNNKKEKAFELFDKSCKEGNFRSCSNLGLMYATGDGVSQNIAKAKEILTQTCEKEKGEKTAISCDNLKFVNQNNRGISIWQRGSKISLHVDQVIIDYHTKMCKEGNKTSCSFLSTIQNNKKVEKRDKTVYEKACKEGDTPSCYNLAVLYDQGKGIKQDKKRASKLYKQACMDGLTQACINLAISYEQGDGIPKNLEKAQIYYKEAQVLSKKRCEVGDKIACQNYSKLMKK